MCQCCPAQPHGLLEAQLFVCYPALALLQHTSLLPHLVSPAVTWISHLQAYGAGTYRALGLYLQRAVLICCAVFLPIAAVWLRSESLLNALGQQPDIAAGAATYLIWLAPCLFISALTECTRRYLLAQQVRRRKAARLSPDSV